MQTANTAIQQIAQINQQLGLGGAGQRDRDARGSARPGHHPALAADECPRGAEARTIRFRCSPAPASSWCPASQASQLSFNNVGTLTATALWSADPSQDGAGTITLTSPGGTQTDLVAENAIQSGEIGAYLQMRDTILPQAQNQLDEMANQMSQALSNQTTTGTAVTSGSQSGFSVDIGGLSAGQYGAAHLYRCPAMSSTRSRSSRWARAARCRAESLRIRTIRSSASISPAAWARSVTQLNAALGTNLQFSNPSGTVLQVVKPAAAATPSIRCRRPRRRRR